MADQLKVELDLLAPSRLERLIGDSDSPEAVSAVKCLERVLHTNKALVNVAVSSGVIDATSAIALHSGLDIALRSLREKHPDPSGHVGGATRSAEGDITPRTAQHLGDRFPRLRKMKADTLLHQDLKDEVLSLKDVPDHKD